MTILLLGATGYLGSNIADHLVKEGNKVICVVRKTSDISRLLNNNQIKLILNDPDQIELTLMQEKIDWVINGVCTYKENSSLYGDMIEANVIFPLSVLNLAIKYHIKNYITMGTSLPKEFNVYSFTKSQFSNFGQFLSLKDGINFADFRLEMFYGGEREPHNRFIYSCAEKLCQNEQVDLTTGHQKRDIIRVEDILDIISLLIHSDYLSGYQILPIGSGEQHSIKEIVVYMRNILGSDSILNLGAIPDRLGEPNTLADIGWYNKIGYKIKYSYWAGIEKECMDILQGKF